jgi:hypothetical protein
MAIPFAEDDLALRLNVSGPHADEVSERIEQLKIKKVIEEPVCYHNWRPREDASLPRPGDLHRRRGLPLPRAEPGSLRMCYNRGIPPQGGIRR